MAQNKFRLNCDRGSNNDPRFVCHSLALTTQAIVAAAVAPANVAMIGDKLIAAGKQVAKCVTKLGGTLKAPQVVADAFIQYEVSAAEALLKDNASAVSALQEAKRIAHIGCLGYLSQPEEDTRCGWDSSQLQSPPQLKLRTWP